MPYIAMHLAFMKLRRRDPDHPRPFKVPGGNGVGYLVAILCIAILALSILLFFWVPGEPLDLVNIAQIGTGILLTLIVGEVLVRKGEAANNTDPDTDRNIDVYHRLGDAFFKTFPQLDDVKFSHAWSGPIALTTRMAVHFQRYFDDKMVYAGGYSGFGVSTSRFGARVGLELLNGGQAQECRLDLATSMPNWMPPEPFRWTGAMITMYALDTADEKGGWRNPWLQFVTKLGFPLS